MDTTRKWIGAVAGGAADLQISKRTGIPQPTLSRQVRTNTLTPENVVKIARAYDASPLDGFVAIGLITADEADSMSVEQALAKATDKQLTAAIVERVEAAFDEDGWLSRPLDEATVTELRPSVSEDLEILVANDEDPREEQDGSADDR